MALSTQFYSCALTLLIANIVYGEPLYSIAKVVLPTQACLSVGAAVFTLVAINVVGLARPKKRKA